MKIENEIVIPDDFAHLVAGRSAKDLAGFYDWVGKAKVAGIGHPAMRATLIGSGWAAPFVDWYLSEASQPRPKAAMASKNPKSGAEMILISEGEFTMGSTASLESPKRRVFLDAYRIGKHPVTVGEFRAYCADKKLDFAKFGAPAWGWKDDHPMVRVNWQEARDFCFWAGGDLPTEAQWEKAARGADGREYPWGNEWDPARCQCSKKALGDAKSTSPVGSYPSGASPFGCLDMAGNVWEWCLDWQAEGYGGQSNRNPTGPRSGKYRVLRGGSWAFYDHGGFRSAYRAAGDPARQNSFSGFRLAGPP